MSASLDDIWDEPAAVSPPRPRLEAGSDNEDAVATRPSKRRRATQQPLFLDSDSDREQGPSTRLVRASSAAPDAPDIDHLFEGLDDDDDGTGLQTLDAGPDLATLQRRAEAAARASSPLTPHAVLPSSSPPRDGGEDRWKDGGKGKGDGKEKKRKPLPKLDEARLLGEDGFPALLKQTKGFVPKGKGHEQSDLNRLISVYQFWAHKLYPKTQFRDTVKTVEKLCHSKRMHVAMSVWRDEAKGLVNGKAPIPDEDADAGSDDEVNLPRDVPVASSREGSPSRGPPTSGSEAEDDFDLDAAIREEEELERARAQCRGAKKAAAATDDVDDEAFWAELAQSSGADVDGIAGPSAPKAPVPPAKAAPAQVPEDELWAEMDDMMDMGMDMDEPINFNKSSATSAPAASSSTASKAPEQTATAVVEDDWDDLYAS